MACVRALCLPTHPLPLHASLIIISTILLMFPSPKISAQSINGSEVDRLALLSFKRGITDPQQVLSSWHGSSDFCSWQGVTCGTTLPPRVVSLNLSSSNFRGVISPSIANLSSLARLNLSDNNLSGQIPSALFNSSSELVAVDLQKNSLSGHIPGFYKMPALQILNLAYNSLSGTIPSSLGNVSSLTKISLSVNMLTGHIPETLSDIQNLSLLSLSDNLLSGNVPVKLYNISSLISIDLAHNILMGRIPPSIGNNLPNLEMLSMSGNNFKGSIPSSLANVSKLQQIDLGYNSLVGPVPSLGSLSYLKLLVLESNFLEAEGWEFLDSLTNCSQLQILALSNNTLNGSVPTSIGNLSASLQLINLGNNQIVGTIPNEIGNLRNLLMLSMEQNFLSGFIPSAIWNLRQLIFLSLSGNRFSGQILPAIGNLSLLSKLYLNNNTLSGSIPASLGNCKQLVILDLSSNNLVGSIPNEIGKLRNLQMLAMGLNFLSGNISSVIWNLRQLVVLNLSRNRFSGPILPTIGSLSLLNKLSLDNNALSGNIPASLGNCKQLVMLDLSSNNLEGSIPSQLLNITSLSLGLNLSNNNLTGSIPPQIGALIHLGALDISVNRLSGEVPSSLGQCVELSVLILKQNMLDGNIPESFKYLKSIGNIDLSQNNLGGQIPEFFVSMTLLQQLDLSFNHFEGQVPTGGIFQNNSAAILGGNPGLCAIAAAAEFQICPAPAAQSKKNPHLLVIVIPTIFAIAFFFFICFTITCGKRRQTHVAPCYKDTKKKVSYGDVIKATNWFSQVNKISSGRTGSIYIGRFQFDTDLVAIKLFHLEEKGAYSNFLTECKVLRNTRHRNMLKAVTVCSTVDLENNEFKAIVYEFMANGSLDMWVHSKLHQNSPKRVLSLGQRIRIAMDVVSALDYMHNQLTPPLIHCDLKPANILLDYDMTAKVGDFGSAMFLASSPGSVEGLVGVGGTIGYIAPEYAMGYKISTGCDVYGFGVLLLEMLTGKRPTDAMFTDGLGIHKFVSTAFPDRLGEVLDPYMFREEQHACAAALRQRYVLPLVEVGLQCSMDSPKDRPGMQEVRAKILLITEEFFEGDPTYSPTLS